MGKCRGGNFCEKHPDAASKIEKYLDFIEEIENRTDISEETKKTFGGIPEASLRPLINERDEEVRGKAIKKISEDLKGKQHDFTCFLLFAHK